MIQTIQVLVDVELCLQQRVVVLQGGILRLLQTDINVLRQEDRKLLAVSQELCLNALELLLKSAFHLKQVHLIVFHYKFQFQNLIG